MLVSTSLLQRSFRILSQTMCTKVNEKSEIQKHIDYDYFLNIQTKRRRPSMLREISHIMSKMPRSTISFAVGVPNANTFPFEEINVKLKDSSNILLKGNDLLTALQYLPSRGYHPLIECLMELQDKVHGKLNWNKTSILVTSGGQESLCNTLEMCMEENGAVLFQNPAYPGATDIVRPYAPNYIPLPQDKDGIIPDYLYDVMKKFDETNKPPPKLIYVNPTGSNPTGVCLSTQRKKEIYDIACEYNLLILEDDSYYFLHFDEELPVSFLSMDVEHRVIRFDSFSKVLSSGIRLGFVTGPEALVRKIELHMQVSTLHSSALPQVIIHKLIEMWGWETFLSHFRQVSKFYEKKRDYLAAAVKKHLDDLVQWNLPTGGMFLWMKVNGLKDTYHLATKRCIDNGLLIIPGHPFISFQPNINCPYIRLSYSLATPEQMDEGCRRLAQAIKEEIKLQRYQN